MTMAVGETLSKIGGGQRWERGQCDVPTTLLLYNCVFAYVNDKFTYFSVCALFF